MTELKPTYRTSESEIQEACVKLLESDGWFVCITSQDRATRRHVKGLPDLIAAKHDHTLYIECKAPGRKLRKSQEEFRDNILPHTGPHLQYWVIDDPAKLAQALTLWSPR